MHAITSSKKRPAGATTPPTGHTQTDSALRIVPHQVPTDKTYASTQAAFALRGHALSRTVRADDGAVVYVISRWGMSRTFSHWGDVLAFLAQIGG